MRNSVIVISRRKNMTLTLKYQFCQCDVKRSVLWLWSLSEGREKRQLPTFNFWDIKYRDLKLKNLIKIMMYWIQFILGRSFQHMCFVSITSGTICKCDFRAQIFSSSHLVFCLPSYPIPQEISNHFQQSSFQISVNVGCWFGFLISHVLHLYHYYFIPCQFPRV